MAVEKLEIETYFGKCKCCLKYGYLRTMWEQHAVEDEIEIYGKMLTQCFSIPWTIQGTEEEDQICEDCIWKLREAHLFKKQVLRSQEQLGQSGEDLIEIEDTEIKNEPDENYDVEYLDEDILENQNYKENSNVESLYDERESHDGEDSQDGKEDQDKDDVIFDDAEDEDYDESQDLQDEDDEDSPPDVTPPRKRKLRNDNHDESDSDTPKPKWPKKLPKEERWRTYKQYTDEDLQKAVESVMARKMNQKQAAKLYRVPRKTLSAKIQAVKNNLATERKTPTSDDDEAGTQGDEIQDNRDAMLIIRKHRENIRSVLEHSNATPIRGFWGVGYVCAFCPEQFIEASTLKIHTQTHGDISKKYIVHHVRKHITRLDVTGLKCRTCDTKMKDLKTLMHHLKQEHDAPMHFDINNHMIPFKFDTKELECVECEDTFTHFKKLSEHMANAHYRNYVCNKCDRGFTSKVNLTAHKEIHRRGKFWCDHCGKFFDTRRKKTTHERERHLQQTKTVKCNYCNKRFHNSAQKTNHELRTHMKQQTLFKCNACSMSYARQRSLKDHINKEHLLYRPYKCPQKGCDKEFFLNRTLKAHVLTHSDAKPFPCTVCSKKYRSEKALRGHMYEHSDERVFKCPKCPKSYVLEENLKKHLKDKH